MAYIRKRGQSWSYTVDVGRDPVTGERKQATKGGFRTKKEAEVAASRAEIDVEDGTYTKPTKQTFREFAESWFVFYSSTGLVKPGSVQVRRVGLNKLLSFFGGAKLTGITRAMYQDMLITLKNEGKADETIKSIHATGKLIFGRAMELNVIKINPTNYAKVPRQPETVEQIENGGKLPKYMEKEELVRFLDVAKKEGKDKDYYVFMVMAYTGVRVGELSALKWKDVDLENQTLSITKTYHNVRNNTALFKLVPPKTKAGIRIIEFDDTIKHIFEKQKALLNTYKMKYRKKYFDGDFVFPNLGPKFPGYPEVQKNIEMRMARLIHLAGMNKNFTPHTFRHTHTTLLAEAGVGLQETMERLGHKDDEVTRLVYLHVTKSMKKGAAKKFSSLMSQVVKM